MEPPAQLFTSRISTWGDSNHHYLPVPAEVATFFLDQGHKRVQLRLNDSAPIHVALRRNKEVGYLVGMGKRFLKQTQTEPGQQVKVEIWPDQTDYQAPMPESLAAVLETDPEAHKVFHSLTSGRQRSLIYYVSSVKSTDRQIEKALLLAANLKLGKLDPRKW